MSMQLAYKQYITRTECPMMQDVGMQNVRWCKNFGRICKVGLPPSPLICTVTSNGDVTHSPTDGNIPTTVQIIKKYEAEERQQPQAA